MGFKKISLALGIWMVLFPSTTLVYAQPKDAVSGRVDSLGESLSKSDSDVHRMEEYETLIRQNRISKMADSLKRADLLQQIELLKENDKLKQKELARQLQQVEQRDSIQRVVQQEQIARLKERTVGYPVVPFTDTLLFVYTKIGPVLPSERAENIARKIISLYNNDAFDPDSLTMIQAENNIDIVFNDLIVLTITESDAIWMEKSKFDLANNYLEKIKSSIAEERQKNSWRNILIRLGLVILILLGTAGLILLLNRLFRLFIIILKKKGAVLFHGVKIRDYQLLPPDRQMGLLVKGAFLLKWAAFTFIMYLSLPLLFSVFPFTEGWANTLFAWVWNPARNIVRSVFGYLPNVFSISVIYLATRYTIRFFKFISQEIETERLKFTGFHADWAMPTFNILKVLLYAFMFVVIFPYLPGSDSKIFQGVSVFLGILFSLGSSSAIANAVAGIVITYMRPFKIGDRVKIGDVTGDVIEKSLLVTRIRTPKNEDITVPNSSILNGTTVNYTSACGQLGLILYTTVTIGYDVPWRKVHQLLIDAALATDGILKDKSPFVLQTSLDDYYVSYQLNAFSDSPQKMAGIYSALHQNIQDKFNEAEVEILSPHYRALRDGNMVTIPSDYLPKDYTAPVFNIKSTD